MGSYERRLIYERTHEGALRSAPFTCIQPIAVPVLPDPFLNTTSPRPYTLKRKIMEKGTSLPLHLDLKPYLWMRKATELEAIF